MATTERSLTNRQPSDYRNVKLVRTSAGGTSVQPAPVMGRHPPKLSTGARLDGSRGDDG
jgi:hypothetical protein